MVGGSLEVDGKWQQWHDGDGHTGGDDYDRSWPRWATVEGNQEARRALARSGGTRIGRLVDGSFVDGSFQLVWQKLFDDGYVVLSIAPSARITAPIDAQTAAMDAAVGRLLMLVAIMCVGCFALVAWCATQVSMQMSAPLTSTSVQSNTLVKNIGGDLFAGVDMNEESPPGCYGAIHRPVTPLPEQVQDAPEEECTGNRRKLTREPSQMQIEELTTELRAMGESAVGGKNVLVKRLMEARRMRALAMQAKDDGAVVGGGVITSRPPSGPMCALFCDQPGEVAALRGQFIGMLFGLLAKRLAAKAPPPANPLCGVPVAPSAPQLATVIPTITQDVKAPADNTLSPPESQPLTKCNCIVWQIVVRLLLPMFIAMLIVLITVSMCILQDLDSWMAEVKTAMIAQELTTLDNQAFERAQLVSATFEGYAGSIWQLSDYFERLYVTDSLPLDTPYQSSFSPADVCAASTSGVFAAAGQCALRATWRHENGRTCSFESSAWWRPRRTITSQGFSSLKLGGSASTDAATLDEQIKGGHLDNIFRATYFATGVDDVFAAFEASEVYRNFPYYYMGNFDRYQTCDANSRSVSTYTPLCRDWYRNAAASTAEYVINSITEDASDRNKNFIAISRAVRSAAGALVGVVAFSVPLQTLTEQIAGCLVPLVDGSCHRYAFVWDTNGNGVLHKNYPVLRDREGLSGPIPFIDLESNGDASFRQGLLQDIIPRGVFTGNWSLVWNPPNGGPPTVWYYSFKPVPNTPFMLGVTVRESLVTGEADKAIERMRASATTLLLISAACCGLALCLLLCITNNLNRRFAKPINKLRKLSRGWAEGNYAEDIPSTMEKSVSSWELKTIVTNFQKLLLALRFGNADYHQGDARKEISNCKEVLELMQSTGNVRGLGVCYNNLANAASRNPATAIEFSVDTMKMFTEAIANCEAMLTKNNEDLVAAVAKQEVVTDDGGAAAKQVVELTAKKDELHATLALRQLNYGLWHLGEKRTELASETFQKAINVTNSPKVLSTIALAMSETALNDGGKHSLRMLLPLMTFAISKALELARATGNQLQLSDSPWLGDLCCACCNIGGFNGDPPAAWACFALYWIPRMTDTTLLQLSLHLKAASPGGELRLLDQKLAPPVGIFDKWPNYPVRDARQAWVQMNQQEQQKAVVFLIDRTWAPILETSIDATAMIFKKHLADADMAAMYSLGDDWIFPMTVKGTDPDGLYKKILDAKKNKGSADLYASMSKVLETAAFMRAMVDPDVATWLIVLTDLVDLGPPSPKIVSEVCGKMSTVNNFNLAIIDSQVISDYDPTNWRWPEWRANVDRMVKEVADGGNKSYHISASSPQEITDAFKRVAALMTSAQANEVL